MAGGSQQDMRSWADLLHNSSQLLQNAAPSAPFPPLQRSLDQLESLSRQLKARTNRYDATGQSIAATRLLAREGINADQLARELKAFELKTSFEDVFPVEATTVEEYLQQVHEMSMLTAILNAQKDNVRCFDDYMMKSMEDDWQKEKREFLNSLSRLPLAPSHPIGKQGGRVSTVWDSGVKSLPDMRSADSFLALQAKPVTAKAPEYSQAVMNLNAARERGLPLKVATTFKDAYLSSADEKPSTKSVNMGKIWYLCQSLLGEDFEAPANLSKRMAMIFGARHHLEAGHEKYMLDTIQSHPAQAALGGSTGNLQRVRAFLRVRLRDYGLLDFDASDTHRQPPIDTTWYQIYFCLRSGYYDDAKAVAQASRVSRSFAPLLTEWIATGGAVSTATATAAFEECERMARIGDRPGRTGYDKKKMLLHAVISGSRQQAERLLREIPVLFTTIEDFMWFMLAAIRDCRPSAAAAADGILPYTLEDLQSYLIKFEPSYYTKNGKDPLVYPYVLILSLQLHAAIVYLTREISSNGEHIDGVHLAIAFADHGVLSEGAANKAKAGNMGVVGEITNIIRHYGLSYARQGDLAVALEYYVQAAAAIGGGAASWTGQSSSDEQRQRNMMLKQLLFEILLRDGGIALLLGVAGTGSEGALKRFYPDPTTQQQLILESARHAQESGHHDKAIELLKRVGAFAMGLEVVNRRLSEAICALATGRAEGDAKVAGLILAGNNILDSCRTGAVGSSRERDQLAEQQLCFKHLETIVSFHKFFRAGRYQDALRELPKLSFLPLTPWTADKNSEDLRNVSPPVQACVPDLLKAALICLDRTPDTTGTARALKTKIANFVANSVSKNWPHDLYEQVARMI